MKETKNSILYQYLKHIRNLVKMLETPSDWNFVIGDTSIIDDGGKERLYFINEVSKEIEIAMYKKNLVSSQKYNINELESLFTGLGVVADLSHTRNKNDRIEELKNILVQELTDIKVENVSFENDGLNKQYILLNKNENYVNLVNKFHTIELLMMKNENPTALEKIVLDKLKNIFELDPVRSWGLILKETHNEYETNYIAKVLISSFSKKSLIDSLKKYIEHHIEEKISFNNRDIVYTLKYFNIFSKINKDNKDEFEKLLDFCFYNFAKSMISEFGEVGNEGLRFTSDLIRLFNFIEFKPNSLNRVTDEFLDELIERLVFSTKTVLSENNNPVYLSQEFCGELSKDWAHKFTYGRTNATMDNLRSTLSGLKIYNKFLEKLVEIKGDINFVFKESSLTDVFVLSAYGRNDEGPLGSINNELRYYSESKIAKDFLLEHQKSCELFSKLISEENIVLELYKMDVDFLMKKVELMSNMDSEKLDPKKENTDNSKNKKFYLSDDDYRNLSARNSSAWEFIEPLRKKITF